MKLLREKDPHFHSSSSLAWQGGSLIEERSCIDGGEVEDGGGASVSASVFRPSSLDGLKTDEEEMSQQLRKCVESHHLHFF